MSSRLIDPIFSEFVALKGSDLYLSVGCSPNVRVQDRLVAIASKPLDDEVIDQIVAEILPPDKREEFYSMMEYNMPLQWENGIRFRVNIFRQQRHSSLVIRRVQTEIPTMQALNLPQIYSDLVMEKRGLVLVTGATGAGKSTSIVAMIDHRNRNSVGHIVTVEDPIEFVHTHQRCIINQRDVGIDTYSYGMALMNVLRQRPDVVLIGEIRDRDTMEHALHFSETGHLCVSTLHAGTVGQSLERIISFFPEEQHRQISFGLATNLRGILAQRLVTGKDGMRELVVEAMLNRGHITSLIKENRIKEISDVMAKNRNEGMQTFEQGLFELYTAGKITEEVAVEESDNPANVRLLIRQQQSKGAFSNLGPRISPSGF